MSNANRHRSRLSLRCWGFAASLDERRYDGRGRAGRTEGKRGAKTFGTDDAIAQLDSCCEVFPDLIMEQLATNTLAHPHAVGEEEEVKYDGGYKNLQPFEPLTEKIPNPAEYFYTLSMVKERLEDNIHLNQSP
eukprot:768562-Hanusia_phi.AAC.2